MRTRMTMFVVMLLLVSRAASAQNPQTPQTPPATGQPGQTQAPAPTGGSPFTGTVDIGGLFSDASGDEARFERYRDDRSGLYSSFSLNRDGATYLFNASASHVGYRDQMYTASFRGRRVNANFGWQSLPLNFSYLTRTPYATDGSTLTLDDNAQRAVQGPTNAANDGTAVGVPCAPGAPPASCGTVPNANLAKANRSIYNSLANQFDLRHTRQIAAFDMKFMPTRAMDVDASFMSTGRSGAQPWGASFAFNNAVELAQPLDQRTNDFRLGASWANERAMVRLGWDGSWFNNRFHSLIWDNPIRLDDFNNGLNAPLGPYDPSGYSNGNGPGRGQQALAPDNSMHVLSVTGLYKVLRRTTINGVLQYTNQRQDEDLIDWTINPLILNTPSVLAAFPHLTDLPRATAEAEARGINALISLSARPYRRVNFTTRYRYNSRDVQTPVFDASEYVRVDAVPEHAEHGLTPQFDNSRHFLDANVAFTPGRIGTLRLGYGLEGIHREGRGFADVTEHLFRASYDAYTHRFFTVRAGFDVGRRRGEGFVDAEGGTDEDDAILGPGGTQPTLRYYDEADRNRVRGSLVLTLLPRDNMDVFVQFLGGKDEYRPDDSAPVSRPNELFGLQEQTTFGWTIGLNINPTDVISAGASYGRERFGSFQESRNANPPPDPQWTDPNRDWTLDNDDRINNFTAYLYLVRAFPNTDIRFSYDFADSDNSFVHGGPRIAALAAAGQFIPLPNVTNTWHRANADVQYFFTNRAGVGLGYYLEKLDVIDWNTVDENGPVGLNPQTETPRLDWLGGLTTGYGNRPYTGNSIYLRLLYRFGA